MGKNVCVVVLGDIGRSPRMQYHSISLANSGHKVDIIGYRGAKPVDALTSKPLVSFHYLNEFPNIPLPRIICYILKTIWQMLNLLFVFLLIRQADYILVQNPPAVPALFACYLYKILSQAKLVIDWHNYAHTIMALTVGPKHILVQMTKFMEKHFGRKADYNFCVTKEMKMDLEGSWGIQAITLYDRPPDMFRPIDITEKHKLFIKLQNEYGEISCKNPNETLFTKEIDNKYEPKEERPALLVSSTSWTEDEDFKILLDALQDYEDHCKQGNIRHLPQLICVITGNGPMKKHYKEIIANLNWEFVKVITPWLEACDYPIMLGSGDLGVSLHTSSSGLDLPMKVVDMFGCGLPVCAYNFKCLSELVKHNVNGFVFNSSKELSHQLQDWFDSFPKNMEQQQKLDKFKNELITFQKLRWTENWGKQAASVFK